MPVEQTPDVLMKMYEKELKVWLRTSPQEREKIAHVIAMGQFCLDKSDPNAYDRTFSNLLNNSVCPEDFKKLTPKEIQFFQMNLSDRLRIERNQELVKKVRRRVAAA